MGGTANFRLDPTAWCLVLVVVPFPSTNWLVTRVWEKAHRVPRCAAQSLTAFPLLKQGYPRPTPFPVRFQLARLWASDSSSSFHTVRLRGMSHQILASRSALAPSSSQLQVVFRQRCVQRLVCLRVPHSISQIASRQMGGCDSVV